MTIEQLKDILKQIEKNVEGIKYASIDDNGEDIAHIIIEPDENYKEDGNKRKGLIAKLKKEWKKYLKYPDDFPDINIATFGKSAWIYNDEMEAYEPDINYNAMNYEKPLEFGTAVDELENLLLYKKTFVEENKDIENEIKQQYKEIEEYLIENWSKIKRRLKNKNCTDENKENLKKILKIHKIINNERISLNKFLDKIYKEGLTRNILELINDFKVASIDDLIKKLTSPASFEERDENIRKIDHVNEDLYISDITKNKEYLEKIEKTDPRFQKLQKMGTKSSYKIKNNF